MKKSKKLKYKRKIAKLQDRIVDLTAIIKIWQDMWMEAASDKPVDDIPVEDKGCCDNCKLSVQ